MALSRCRPSPLIAAHHHITGRFVLIGDRRRVIRARGDRSLIVDQGTIVHQYAIVGVVGESLRQLTSDICRMVQPRAAAPASASTHACGGMGPLRYPSPADPSDMVRGVGRIAAR
jgi:hypothetical protein